MDGVHELYKANNSRELLTLLLNSRVALKFAHNRRASEAEITIVKEKIGALIDNEQYEVLLRGVTKSIINERLISKLNSNDSLYDGLFLVGEKAKNFLKKSEIVPHSIKIINSVNIETATWIFESYRILSNGPIDLNFFKCQKNKQIFIDNLKDNEKLTDYYLFGLHTINSELLVNFVSTTTSPEVAFQRQIFDKLIVVLWRPSEYIHFFDFNKLASLKDEIIKKKLPVLEDSFYPNEKEISFKGIILPHFIIGIHDLEANEFILNPAILDENPNWLKQGFDIDQTNFMQFIKQTKYQRFLMLSDKFEEKKVC